jgi:hypothetical protein
MNTEFNEQDSLRIINEMIARVKSNFQRGGIKIMLFWGYLTAMVSLGNFILLQVLKNPNQSYWIWTIMIIGYIASYFIQRKIGRTAIVKNHFDTIIKYLWCGFGISMIILQVVFWTMRASDNVQFIYLIPVIMIMCAIAQFGTAIICHQRSYYIGAATFWIGAIACAIFTVIVKSIDYQFLVLAISMIIAFIIPNHLLNKKLR